MTAARLQTTRFLLALACLAARPALAGAQAPDPVKERLDNSPRHHEWVDLKQGDRTVRAFVVFPEVNKKAAAVLVIHENKGLTEWVRGVADQVAEAGYVAIAPDCLSGTGPGGGNTDAYPSIDAATQGIYKLKDEQVMADLDAAFAYAQKLDAANGKVVTMGFCWGGGKSFAYAAHNPKLTAALVFYGSAPADEAMEKIHAPVYGFYGENDQRITGQLLEVSETMKDASKTFEPIVYDGAGHGFLRTGEQASGSPADRKAHDEAWAEVKRILAGL
jgi:carboxymethylenebutenolidase